MGAFLHFLHYIFNNSTNRLFLAITLIAGILQMIVFKHFYPYPDFISDSYSYIETNLYHMNVNLWPIGYSRFIAFIHLFTPSHLCLVYIQYFILLASLLYFFFSVLYLYHISPSYAIVLFIFLFFNPAFLVLANCILSDAIFFAVSLLLFTQYLWMFHKPKKQNILLQAALITIAFSIRYTAIYYPLLTVVAILLSNYKWLTKLGAIVLPWLMIIPFIIYTQQETKKLTGTAEFSVFGGWQLANNALYMYGHIEVDTSQLPPHTQTLDSLTKAFWKAKAPTEEDLAAVPGTFFIKVPSAILKPYMFSYGRANLSGAPGWFQAWGSVSPVYNTYGKWLITHYPLAFSRYYLYPNVKNYFNPYLEKFGTYNIGKLDVWKPAVKWFNLKDNKVSLIPHINFQGRIFRPYPLFFMGLNIYFAICAFFFLTDRNPKKETPTFRLAVLLTIAFLVINFSFSVFATPVVLRYQILPMVILFTFSLLLTEKQFTSAQ